MKYPVQILHGKHLLMHHKTSILFGVFSLLYLSLIVLYIFHIIALQKQIAMLHTQQTYSQKQLKIAQKQAQDLKNQDQYKINQQQQITIKNIEETYTQAKSTYESLVDLKLQAKDTKDEDQLFAESLQFLSQKNYSSASADLTLLGNNIKQAQDTLAAAAALAAAASVPGGVNAPANNTAPGSGFNQQTVTTDTGSFSVSIIAADLNSTRVIADSASDGDCSNNCPVLGLSDYVSRSGAFAGINGTFFCPPEYPSCAGKTNSFDTLLMNKNKHYLNSSNNIYSTVPLVYFTGNTMGVRAHSSDWGRDTGVDSVIAMQPLLILNGQSVYGGSGDPKFNNHGTKNFIANIGSTVYIGVIYNATMDDATHVLKTLGMQNALNLDEGGSTALWYGGYKAGPGRNIPNAILFVRK